jgi:hypothetical protein
MESKREAFDRMSANMIRNVHKKIEQQIAYQKKMNALAWRQGMEDRLWPTLL